MNKAAHRLSIVGIGPGEIDKMTFQAAKAIKSADFVIGYKPYLELIRDLLENKHVISSSMGKEVDRAKMALDLLDDGSVALVSSGDPNIYGMAGLGLEMASTKANIDNVLDKVDVIPGVTSFAAAACKAGMVFRESIAVISLSDLLTPWSSIEKRLRLAAEYHMPAAIYNPRSRRRDWQLDKALEIYGPETDVLIARNVARAGEEFCWTSALQLLDGEELRDRIDMFTILILGGSGMLRRKMSDNDAQNCINIVGIGPGSSNELTFEAERLLKGSAKIFGAERYQQVINGISSGEQIEHNESFDKRMSLRFQDALAASQKGFQASILTGGDPSIFSSAWRIFEEAKGCHLNLSPGVSAFSAVAARTGAPLVNDFVLFSNAADASKIKQLSETGFGIAIYNVSEQDLATLLPEIDPSRPCVLARDVSRTDETAWVMSATELIGAKPMGHRYTLIVASVNSYIKDGRIITKRGYQTKYIY